MKALFRVIRPVVDLILALPVYAAATLLKTVRRQGIQKLPWCKRALLKAGVFPIRNHYYEPQFDFTHLKHPLDQPRTLPGIEWNLQEQLEFLCTLGFANELADLPQQETDRVEFYLHNTAFESGDAEFWYQLIRSKKPKRIFEVGSGHSTLMAIKALGANEKEDAAYRCKHICIEPYEAAWLEQTGVSVVRKKIEDVDLAFFGELEENDILFIDSSHMIRPEGDVLFEYLEILPSLAKGVIVHIHDIFSPRNYPKQWLVDEVRFWNEQYLLEAFLSHNRSWKIIAALNYLQHSHPENLKQVAPFLTPDREPGSIYIQRVD